MLRSRILVAFSALALASCTKLPELPTEYGIRVADLVNEIQCEIAGAQKFTIFTKSSTGWRAGADLRLELVSESDIGLSSDIGSPLAQGMLLATASVDNNARAKKIVTFKFQKAVSKFLVAACDHTNNHSANSALQGNLGIFDWLSGIESMRADTGIVPASMTYEVSFVVTNSAGLGPKLSLLPIGASKLGIGASASGKRISDNKLTLIFSEIPEDQKPAPTEVIILRTPTTNGTVTIRRQSKQRIDTENLQQLEKAIQRTIQTEQTIIQQ